MGFACLVNVVLGTWASPPAQQPLRIHSVLVFDLELECVILSSLKYSL